MLKVCIFGGGAIGGHIAGHLARAGLCEVSVIARGKVLDAIRKRGLRVQTPEADFTVAVRATDDPSELGVQDYVFLTLKAHQVDAALDRIKPLIGAHTVVLPPTTGIPYYFFHQADGAFRDRQLPRLDPGGRQWRAIPPSQVLGCVYWIGAHSIEPGVIAQDGPKAGVPIGELDGSRSARAEKLAELLSASGIASRLNGDIRAAIWVKFVNSLCWNPVAVLTLATLGQMERAGNVVPIVQRMMEEADLVASTLGLRIPQSPGKRIAMTLSATNHKMSMLQDLEHGRPLELGALEESIQAMSELAGIETPTLDQVLALTKLRAQALSSASTQV